MDKKLADVFVTTLMVDPPAEQVAFVFMPVARSSGLIDVHLASVVTHDAGVLEA